MFQKIKILISKIKNSETIDYSGIFFQYISQYRQNFGILLLNRFVHFICYIKGVKLGRNVIFNGIPIIQRVPNSSIIFGSNCTFNSAKKWLLRPCAIVTEDKNAEIVIGNNTGVTGLRIFAVSKVTIGNNVLIGLNCTILDNDGHHSDLSKRELDIIPSNIPSRPIVIEDNVFIGMECTILKGVTIGKNSVIGARSVVFNDIPENCIAAGNPCKIIMRKNP